MKKTRIQASGPVPKLGDRRLTPTRTAIAAKAEALWREKGCPEGRNDEIWLEAERSLSGVVGGFNSDAVNNELENLFPEDDHGEVTAL